MFWDFDEETTNAMMKDVGVSVLEDDEDDGMTMEDDMRCGPKPTPPLTASTELVVPGVKLFIVISMIGTRVRDLTLGRDRPWQILLSTILRIIIFFEETETMTKIHTYGKNDE